MALFDGLKKKKNTASSAPAQAAPTGKIVRVSDYLSEKHIIFFSAGPSKQQVLGSLIGALDLPDPTAALKAIMTREEAGSTVIAPGLALPHARLSGLGGIKAALGLCPAGVVDATSKEPAPIKIFMLFLGPSEDMRTHLAFLASVSSLFQVESLADALLQLTSPDAVLQKIREAEKAI